MRLVGESFVYIRPEDVFHWERLREQCVPLYTNEGVERTFTAMALSFGPPEEPLTMAPDRLALIVSTCEQLGIKQHRLIRTLYIVYMAWYEAQRGKEHERKEVS